jgi:hypothetical protein
VNPIPPTKESLLLRTDFSDDAAWVALCAAISQPVGEFQAYVSVVSDPQYSDLVPEELPGLVPRNQRRSFAFVADCVTLSHPEHPVLVVDLRQQPGRTIRVIPSEAWGIENNLSLGNMDFDEFADAADQDGIFRGFPHA